MDTSCEVVERKDSGAHGMRSPSQISLAPTPRMPDKVDTVMARLQQDPCEEVIRYGDIVTDREACERFLGASKGNVDTAVEMITEHLRWRTSYSLDTITDEDFSNFSKEGELYWAGQDVDGTPTLTWRIAKHDATKHTAEAFLRFFVYTVECGMRESPEYPNTKFNIFFDIEGLNPLNFDNGTFSTLQSILAKNYPKVRRTLFVFPLSWWAQLFWGTVVLPLLSLLQPDIESKLCILRGDHQAQLRERYAPDQLETRLGGTLDLVAAAAAAPGGRRPAPRPYEPRPLLPAAAAPSPVASQADDDASPE